ncbi:MAG: GEVED domain-containing protein [Chloroflexi bacterium]|nr:GEVED domain-containing protein [Chloroflexota bacterium]
MRRTARRPAVLLVAVLALLGCEPATESAPALAPTAPAATPTADVAPALTPATTRAATAAASPTAAPALAADFGDAPDGAPAGYRGTRVVGRFPTRLHTRSSPNPGAHVLMPGLDRLGETVTLEAGADDRADPDGRPNLINGDAGDDGVLALTLALDQIPAQARLDVIVALGAVAPPGPRYLNVLIDMNLDGRWSVGEDATPEWAVQNLTVNVAPGSSRRVRTGPFDLGSASRLPDGAWMRVALTRERIVGDAWDGGGGWQAGEIEDYRLALPRTGAGASETAAPLVATICPERVHVPAGTLMLRTGCRLVNLGGDGAAELRLVRAEGDARLVPDRIGRLDLRAGSEQEIPLVLVRGEAAGHWRYQTGERLAAQVTDGSVVLGSQAASRTLAVVPADERPLFHIDRTADYFSIHDLSPVNGFAFADIRRIASGTTDLTAADLDLLRSVWFSVEPVASSNPGGSYAAFLVDLADALPRADGNLGFQIAFALQATDASSDDWKPQVGDFDLFERTDTWFELIYRPDATPRWRLQRRTAIDPGAAAPTGAVAFVDGGRVLLLVPALELQRGPENLRFRVTSFVHERGDPLGADGPSMADAAPGLGQPLAAFGSLPVAVG